MKKYVALFTLLFFSMQFSFAQKSDPILIKREQAKTAYENEEYEKVVTLVNEIQASSKQTPTVYYSLRIMALNEIVKKNPYEDYQRIITTRKLIADYFKNPQSKKDIYYEDIIDIKNVFDSYPKDLVDFEKAKKEKAIEDKRIQEEAVIAAAAAKVKEAEMAVIRENKRISDSIKNEEAKIEAEKNRIADEEAYVKRQKELDAEIKRQARKIKPKLSSFSSLGIQSGEIAKYGLLYERGGKRTVGFHISARTSNTSEEEILNGSGIENKTEADLGPNFRIFNRFYLNIGLGYGYYDKILRNDYAGTLSLEKTGYLLATSGVMIRISRVININGGVSFMDVDKAFYKPEITFGISFNLKKKYSY